MGVQIGEILRQERERAGLTQTDLGKRLHVSRSSISAYEMGRPIPPDVLGRAGRELNSLRLAVCNCFLCKSNLLRFPWLDRVDKHPVVVIHKLGEELEEASAALGALPLVNKNRVEDLTDADHKAVHLALAQVADLLPGIAVFFAVVAEAYGFDLSRVSEELYLKLRNRRYCSYYGDAQSREEVA